MYLSNSLNTIINELKKLQTVNNKMVKDIVGYTKPSVRELEKYNLFQHCLTESYGRQLIHDNGRFKLLLMSWQPGDFTAIHNHGHAEWGCVYTFGDATHRLYNIENDKLVLTESNCFKKGEIASVCGNLTHLMGNSTNKEFFTLHIYGSNKLNSNISADAKVFVPEHKKAVTTNGSAYLNMKENLKLTEKHFTNISQEALADYFTLIKPFYNRNRQKDTLDRINSFEQKPELFYNKP